MDPYIIFKTAHILSSTVLFGTGIGTAFHMWWTYRSGTPENIAHAAKNTVIADWFFTTPAGVIQPLTGLWLILDQGYDLLEPWLIITYALYILAFSCWVPVVWLQIQVRNLSETAAVSHQPLPSAAHRHMKLWFILGWPAFLSLTAVFYLMVAKPTF